MIICMAVYSLYSICARDIYNMNAGNNVKVAADAFLEILYSLKNKYCIKLLSAQDRAFIYEFARMIFAYINDKSIEILLLSCFAAADQKQSSGIYLRRKMGKTLGIIYNIS